MNTWKDYRKKILMSETTILQHLEPDILECEVKWALGIITTSFFIFPC